MYTFEHKGQISCNINCDSNKHLNKLKGNKMQTLTLSTFTLDQDNTFVIEVKGYSRMKRMTVLLKQGYHKKGDGIYWGLQGGSCLKSEYTAKDNEERARLAAMTPIRKGDIVLIDGVEYKANVLGDFSDCAIFEKV